MAKYHKEWARKQRKLLMRVLGNKCAACGCRKDLTFDCIDPQGDRHHRFDTSQRMSFYRAQFRAFNLQILCESCNVKKGDACIDFRAPALLNSLRQLNLLAA